MLRRSVSPDQGESSCWHIGLKRLSQPARLPDIYGFRGLVPGLDRPAAEQAIATTENRFQQSSIWAKRLANRRYMKVQRIFLYDRAWPYPFHNLVLVYELTVSLNQNLNDLKCTAPERNRHTV
jgi:hypothetical protein